MRLKRLDLTRYGKFTNYSIDFGGTPQALPDLHVIYGPNESGKSTTFAAFLDLLFGIGAQSPFDFLHPYSAMRVGGRIEFAGEVREFVRIKRTQNSLLDANGEPIPDRIIRGELGSIDRDSYRTMFSLDDETLERGGESILASKGDLGELLFSASAGLAGLSQRILDLRGEADGFYKYRARSGALADLKSRLAELKAERERFDTLASDYARLIDIRDRAACQYDQAIADRTRIQRRIDEIQRQLVALPRLSALRALRRRLEPLADLPDPPPAWTEELPGLQAEEIELGIRMQAVEDEIERRSRKLESSLVDETALSLSSRVERLADLRARHVTAEKDIPERRLQLREAELVLSGILARMEREGESNPRRLILNASTVGRLRELVETRSGIDRALATATTELADARRRLVEAESKLYEAGGDPEARRSKDGSRAQLAAAVAILRTADHDARRRLAEHAYVTAVAILNDRLRALNPWRGDADDLIGMQCPEEQTVQHWKAALDDRQRVIAHHVGDVERLTTEFRRLGAERDAIAVITGLATDKEAAAVRAEREQAWSTHRRDLSADSAEAFEAAMRHDDIVAAGRLGHMAELAQLHQAAQALSVTEAELRRAAELKDAAVAALQALREEIAAVVRIMAPSFNDGMTLANLEGWLERREKALEARGAVLSAEADLRATKSDAQAARDRLRAALDGAAILYDTELSFATLLNLAQDALDCEAKVQGLRVAAAERRHETLQRERAKEKAAADEQGWVASWANACKSCWLGDKDSVPTLATVREILSAVAELRPALEKRAGLIDRIEKMEKDQISFREEVSAIGSEMEIPTGSKGLLDLAQHIDDRVRDAGAERARRAEAIDALESIKEKKRSIEETAAIHAQRKQLMTSFFGVSSLAEVAAKLLDVGKRNELRQQAEDAERDILEALGLAAIDEAERILDSGDRAALEAELIEIRARFDDQDNRCHELFAARSRAVDQVEAIGGDSVVAEIEEQRRTTLLEVEEGAVRYLQTRAGAVAMEQALRIYRERHRSSMMARASEAFRTISRGAYDELATQPSKDGETLIALSAGGGSKAAGELSKGTRFQLYLALRVAGYHEFARAHCAVPFIADDIMETFDDFRAEEAFRLFTDMARVGQVIYLTHHRHLCGIARKICPTARIHDLSGGATRPEDATIVAAA